MNEDPIPEIVGLAACGIILFGFIWLLAVRAVGTVKRHRCKNCLYSWVSCDDFGLGRYECPNCGINPFQTSAKETP